MSQQLNIPMMQIKDIAINMLTIVAIDRRDYEPGKDGRLIVLHLAHIEPLELLNEDADAANQFYLQTFSQFVPK